MCNNIRLSAECDFHLLLLFLHLTVYLLLYLQNLQVYTRELCNVHWFCKQQQDLWLKMEGRNLREIKEFFINKFYSNLLVPFKPKLALYFPGLICCSDLPAQLNRLPFQLLLLLSLLSWNCSNCLKNTQVDRLRKLSLTTFPNTLPIISPLLNFQLSKSSLPSLFLMSTKLTFSLGLGDIDFSQLVPFCFVYCWAWRNQH